MYCINVNFFKTIIMFKEYKFLLRFIYIKCAHQQIQICGKAHAKYMKYIYSIGLSLISD